MREFDHQFWQLTGMREGELDRCVAIADAIEDPLLIAEVKGFLADDESNLFDLYPSAFSTRVNNFADIVEQYGFGDNDVEANSIIWSQLIKKAKESS